MRIRARTQTALKNGVGFVLIGAVVGAIISVADLDNFSLIVCLKCAANGALIGAIVVAPIVIFEALFIQNPAGKRLQGLSFRAVTAVRSIIYVMFIYVGFGVERFISQRPGDTTLLLADHLIHGFVIACLLVILLGVLIQLSRLLGPTILRKLISGRYHRPREEQRIFLLLDVTSSTELADTIGNARFHELLDQMFFDLTDPILENDGEIYRYVGDQIIVSWLRSEGLQNGRAAKCCFAAIEKLEKHKADYLRRFDAAPDLHAALHCGPVISGEMGDVRREIVYLGDTLNITAHMEKACGETGYPVLASGEFAKQMVAVEGIAATEIGPLMVGSNRKQIVLFALSIDPSSALNKSAA